MIPPAINLTDALQLLQLHAIGVIARRRRAGKPTCADAVPDIEKLGALTEELGEVARALNDNESTDRLRSELLDAATAAVLWAWAVRGPNTTSQILRVYEPDECDAQGVPLDWAYCRSCFGVGCGLIDEDGEHPCEVCAGHGSLKAAALYAVARRIAVPDHEACGGTGRLTQVWPQHDGSGDIGDTCHCVTLEVRCEDCQHPLAPAVEWDPPQHVSVLDGGTEHGEEHALLRLRYGNEPVKCYGTHWSPCDTQCRHGGPMRARYTGPPSSLNPEPDRDWHGRAVDFTGPAGGLVACRYDVQADWRPVDVRTLGWRADLRRERLAALCLRCYAIRNPHHPRR